MEKSLLGREATIDRREGSQFVLRFTDGQEIVWASEALPAECREGDVVWLTVTVASTTTNERRALARDILNEIFDSTENQSASYCHGCSKAAVAFPALY